MNAISSSLIIRLLVNYFLIYFIFETNSWATCHMRIRVSVTLPFYIKTPSGDWTGLSIELGKILLKEAGCTFAYEKVSWSRAIELMRSGGIDMMTNLSITEERKKYMHFIGPQMDESVVLVLRDDIKLEINSLDDLKKITGKIGRQKGAYRGEKFKNKLMNDEVFSNKFEINYSSQLNRKKMHAGRIVGMIDEFYAANFNLKNDDYKNFKIHDYIIHKYYVYFGFSKKSVSKGMLKSIKNAYDSAIQKGLFESVIKKYK
ncbi:substrate-binding periplasmic protein [Spartinivicinus ruber]|uniref:substrate-binding periplasmic protein n=1 Tax=Spartinivicinus ruber TaxID=2683272 RepID=UPI0013D7026D|nr:transporter substrate-binding domain-containing protein [Spartinivicinus ruber]